MEVLLVSILISSLVVGCGALCYSVGYRVGLKIDREEKSAGPVKERIRKIRYNSGNLLDPITPEEQRLEKKLGSSKKEDENEED
jgi:hypothetical protein